MARLKKVFTFKGFLKCPLQEFQQANYQSLLYQSGDMQTNEEQLIRRLRKLDENLGSQKLPGIPKFLVELARNQKKLNEVRELKGDKRQMTQNEMKCQGIALQSFKRALIELDVMHKKAVVQLKALEPKIARLKELETAPTNP